MGKKLPETVINDWCEFHLDALTSRWPASSSAHKGAKVSRNGFVYAGDGIRAALEKADYAIIPVRSKEELSQLVTVEVSVNGTSKFKSTQVDACTIERTYDGSTRTTTIILREHDAT